MSPTGRDLRYLHTNALQPRLRAAPRRVNSLEYLACHVLRHSKLCWQEIALSCHWQLEVNIKCIIDTIAEGVSMRHWHYLLLLINFLFLSIWLLLYFLNVSQTCVFCFYLLEKYKTYPNYKLKQKKICKPIKFKLTLIQYERWYFIKPKCHVKYE